MGIDEIMTQDGASEDSFLDGWEETTPETVSEDDSVDQAGGDQPGGEQTEEKPAGGDQPGEGPGVLREDGGAEKAQEQEGGQEAQKDGADQPAREAPRTWNLNYMGKSVTATESDMKVLAQKGMDYDRIRAGYDEAKPVMALFRDFAEKAGLTVPEYLGRIRAQAKQAQGMSEEEARRSVELEDREAKIAQREAGEREAREAAQAQAARETARREKVQADIAEFMAVFPDAAAKYEEIPQSVWDDVDGGMSLVGAYSKYRAKAAADAAEAAQREANTRAQNEKNAANSTGSMKTSGTNVSKDPFLEGWDE